MSGDVTARSGRRRIVRSGRRLAVMGAAAAFTVLLAQHTTTAAFTAQTGDAGNSASTAATFCSSPSSTTVLTGVDTRSNGTSGNTGTNYGSATTLPMGTSAGGDGYAYIRFDLLALPARCTITSATLRLYASTSQAATLNVYRAATAWSAGTLTWSNQPAPAGTPVPLTVPGVNGTAQSFPVTALVQSMYPTTGNHGFLVRDVLTLSGTTRYQIYDSFDHGTAANRPKLDISWG
jgi:hypothetical protein